MMEKIKMIDSLTKNEQSAIFIMFAMANANKKLMDNFLKLIAQ
jgi:hypothetical protein